jgi:hypothetical protein
MRSARLATSWKHSRSTLATRRLRCWCRAPKSVIYNRIARTRGPRKRHPCTQRGGERRPDAPDSLEPFDRSERAVLHSVVDDAAGEHGPDARQRFNVGLCCDVEVDWYDGHSRIGRALSIGPRGRQRVPSSRRCAPTGPAPLPARPRSTSCPRGFACRIDGGKLKSECVAGGGVVTTIVSRRSHDANSRAENDDSGEKQEGLAFGGRRHGANSSRCAQRSIIRLLPYVARSRDGSGIGLGTDWGLGLGTGTGESGIGNRESMAPSTRVDRAGQTLWSTESCKDRYSNWTRWLRHAAWHRFRPRRSRVNAPSALFTPASVREASEPGAGAQPMASSRATVAARPNADYTDRALARADAD